MELTKTKYQQTEIGLIPEDWRIERFGERFNVKNGLNKAKEFFGYGSPIVNYMDVFGSSGLYKKNIKGKVFVNSQEKRSYDIKKGDVLFTRTSETPEEIGMSSVILEELEDTVFSGFVLRARPIDNTFNNEFKKYCFRSNEVRSQIIGTCSYTTRALTNGRNLSAILIPTPPLPEQKAIAEVLSDVDRLIQVTEQKLAKKRAIKQGAMQKLLTPKEDWEVYKIQDIAQVGRGRVISHKEINKAKEKKYPVYSSQTANKGVMGYLDSYDFDGEYITWTTDGENAGTVFHRLGKFNCTNVCGTIKLHKGNPKFISFMLATLTPKHVSKNLANPKLMNDPMKKIKVPFPHIEIQTRIATILSDMDKENELIEQQIAKYKTLKQGLMQELLTGKTRLTV